MVIFKSLKSIFQVFEDIQTHKEPDDDVQTTDDPLLKIYQVKEKRLKAEVEVFKNKKTEGVYRFWCTPQYIVIVFNDLLTELRK